MKEISPTHVTYSVCPVVRGLQDDPLSLLPPDYNIQ